MTPTTEVLHTSAPVSKTASIRVLIVDDESSAREGLSELIGSWGYHTTTAADGMAALDKIATFTPDIIICDLIMPKMDGMSLLKELKNQSEALMIFLTAQGSIDSAVGAIKEGAYDYLTKPIDIVRLQHLLAQISEKNQILNEVRQLRQQLRELGKFGALIGQTPIMKQLFHQIELAAPSSASVLINGESGTGKELVARALHEMSQHKQGPFVAINCSAIPATLLESEIFGYERGAFTGAVKTKLGCYELANQGTLFLDEIAEMSPELQIKLLRVLEDGTFRRIGGRQELHANVRVVAASNIPFHKAVAEGKLREDLFYRLNVFCLELPPLSQRRDDIPLLTQHFINEFNRQNHKKIRGAENDVLTCLQNYAWPGNVRELRNTIERAIIIAKKELLTLADLPSNIATLTTQSTVQLQSLEVHLPIGMPLAKVEQLVIEKTLQMTRGNKTAAAKQLGISTKTLHNKLNSWRV